MRASCFNFGDGFDEVQAVTAMFINTGSDGEYVGVKDNIFRWEPDVGEHLIGAFANIDLALFCIGLAFFIERHDNDGGAISHTFARMFAELVFAFFHADRVDDGFARHAFQTRLNHRPFGRIDHQRHAGDIGFGGDTLDELGHGFMRVEQAFIHIDVDNLRAVFHLIARDLNRSFVIAR